MVKDDDGETLGEYQLRILWEEREAEHRAAKQDRGFSLASLIKTPERVVLTLLIAAQGAGFGPEVLAALAKIIGGK